MKKALKIIGVIVVIIIIALVVLLSWLAKRPAIAEDYYKKTASVGELEKKYQSMGNHEVEYMEKPVLENFKKYEIWYPSGISDLGKCPLVIFSNLELAHALEWDYDVSNVNIPVMLVSTTGDGDVKLVVSPEQLADIYNALPENIFKVMAVRNNADHGTCLIETDAYMTAWFLMTLCGDAEAAQIFTGEKAEIKNNELYENVEISISK